jgi:hypothetical protein
MPARLLLAFLLTAAAAYAQPSAALFSQVDQMVTALSEITGWPIAKVPSEILSKNSFKHYLEELKPRATPGKRNTRRRAGSEDVWLDPAGV